jgi:hypothetical protein
MAKVERKPQRATHKGLTPTPVTGMLVPDTQLIPNKNGDVLLRLINGSGEATKATIVTPGEVDGNAVGDLEVEVGATSAKVIGPFDPAIYNNEEGQLEVKLSKVTTVSLEVIRVG